MARRLPFGPVNRPRMLAAAAAAVLVAALVLTGRLLDVGGGEPDSPPRLAGQASPAGAVSTQAPYRLGSVFTCPPSWPVLAMANHLSYPAGHPTKPSPSASAVACYHTEDQAARAGYPVAPLPPGVLEVDGIYLTPTSQPFQARCQQVADRLHFVVPCPGLLPTAPPGAPPPQLCGPPPTCQRGQPVVISQADFTGPFGYTGTGDGNGGLFIVAAPAHSVTGQSGLQCRDEYRLATLTVQGTWAALGSCSDDPESSWFGRSVLLHWWQRDTLVVVSVIGHSDANRRLVVALANHLLFIPPRR
jgi:hypothetical protein